MSYMQIQEPGAADQRPGFMDRIRSLSIGSVLVGALIGVIVGLILGWLVWPVQWTEAWPGDLSSEAKAQYLAAVAQVYAYYPDDRAAETARTRLYDLEDNIAEEITAASMYFAENPQRNSNVYITMLNELAAGLGVSASTPPLIDADAQGAAPPASDGPSWLRWIFSALLVLVLVGGGVYILSKLARDRRSGAGSGDGAGSLPPQTGYPGTQPVASGSGGFAMPPPDDYRFEQEPDEDTGEIQFASGTPVTEGQDYGDDTYFDDGSASAYTQAQSEQQYPPQQQPAPQAYDELYAPPRQSRTEQQPAAATGAEVASRPYGQQTDKGSAAQQPARSEAGKILNTYVVHYQAGMEEFEQSHNIMDPASSRYIGECGMGVNMKNGILQDVPEHVIALDVWLFDQRQDHSLGHQTRVLLSEYAIDHDLEQTFVRERPDGPSPVVAQPGVSFQLVGENLIMDCEILDAEYSGTGQDSGIFQDVKLEMTVRSRT